MVNFILSRIEGQNTYRIGTGSNTYNNGYTGDLPETLILPHFHDDKEIVEIGRAAFFPSKETKYIYVEEGIQILAHSSLRNIQSLIKITLPSSLLQIGTSCFDDCFALENVYINQPSKLSFIGSSAFSTCISLSEIIIPSTVTTIVSLAFNQINQSFKIYYCGIKQFNDVKILNETNDVEIIVPRFGVKSFGGRKTKIGITPCDIKSLPQTCITKAKTRTHLAFIIFLI